MDNPEQIPNQSIYGLAIVIAILGFLMTLLALPPWYWHLRSRNVGATALISWVIYTNFQTFLNAVIWPSQASMLQYSGQILCDIEVKLAPAASVGVPIALACVLQTLAAVLDTDRSDVSTSVAQQRRTMVIQLLLCLGLPVLHMSFLFVVQSARYALFTISGCVPMIRMTWVTIVFVFLPPLFATAVGAWYAVLVLFRLSKYRTSVATILERSNLNRNRFLRLYILCLTCIFGTVIIQLYILTTNLRGPSLAYDWGAVHSAIDRIQFVDSEGTLLYDHYVWLALGLFVFLLFGLGQEATAMYRRALEGMGLGWFTPLIRRCSSRAGGSVTTTLRSLLPKTKRSLSHDSIVSTQRTQTSLFSATTANADCPRHERPQCTCLGEDTTASSCTVSPTRTDFHMPAYDRRKEDLTHEKGDMGAQSMIVSTLQDIVDGEIEHIQVRDVEKGVIVKTESSQ